MNRLPEYEIPYSSAETVTPTIETPASPTGDPAFKLTTGFTPDATSWSNGSWNGAYDADTTRIKADSPNIGDGETLDINQGQTYVLWMRWTAGDDIPVRPVARIKAI